MVLKSIRKSEQVQIWDVQCMVRITVCITMFNFQVFHNEGWSTLFRTVNSVINRSPPQFLHEVVLVDDKSELEHLHEKLDREIEKPYYKGKVIVVRNKEREGLIRYYVQCKWPIKCNQKHKRGPKGKQRKQRCNIFSFAATIAQMQQKQITVNVQNRN